MPLRVLICNIFNLANKHHAKALGLDQSMPLWSPQIESWLPDTPPPRSPFSIDNLILTFAVNRQTARCLPGWGLPRLRGQLGITKQNDFYPSLQVPPPSQSRQSSELAPLSPSTTITIITPRRALPNRSRYLKWKKRKIVFLTGPGQKKKKKKVQRSQGRRLAGARANQHSWDVWEFWNAQTEPTSLKHAAPRPAGIKGGLWALGQTASESAPEQHPRPPLLLGQDLGRRTPANCSLPRPSPPRRPAHYPSRTGSPAALWCVGVFASALAGTTPARHDELPHRQDARPRRHPSPLGQAGEFLGHRFPVRSHSPFSFPRTTRGRKS